VRGTPGGANIFGRRPTQSHYRAVLGSHVVCPSVRLSATLMDCDDIGWNSSKIISRLVSPGYSLFADPNTTGLFQGEHSQNFRPNGGGVRKKVIFGVQKL